MRPFIPAMSHCRVGVGRRDITPPVGIYSRCWGAALHEAAEGIHRPFSATALCLTSFDRPNAPPFFLLALDLGWLGEVENRELLDSLRSALAIEPARLLVMLSHTHAGPNLATTRVDKPGGDLLRPYFERVIAMSIEAALDARANLEEVRITFGAGACELAANRDTWDEASDQWVCGFNPEGTADDTLLVGRVVDGDGQPVATLVNYGCHPTTLGPENRLLSPDYVGAMREVLEREDGALVLFALGACGDTGPRDGFVGDTAVADRNGRSLGFAAAAALELLPPPGAAMVYAGPIVSGATLGAWRYEPVTAGTLREARILRGTVLALALPLKPREPLATLRARHAAAERAIAEARARGDLTAERDATAEKERAWRRILRVTRLPEGDSVPVGVWVWQVGHAFLVGIPAEPYAVLQIELRRRFPDRSIVVAVVTNGCIDYLLPTDRHGTGLYQDWVSFAGPGGLELVTEAVAAQIEAWTE